MQEQKANVLNCSQRGINNLDLIRVPDEATWLIADFNDIPIICPSDINLRNLEHISVMNSNVTTICHGFFQKLQNLTGLKYLNLAHNNIKELPKEFPKIKSLNEIYLGSNPIHCHCGMLWLTEWLNSTKSHGEIIVKDYTELKCSRGKWDKTPVNTLDKVTMGCFPDTLAT